MYTFIKCVYARIQGLFCVYSPFFLYFCVYTFFLPLSKVSHTFALFLFLNLSHVILTPSFLSSHTFTTTCILYSSIIQFLRYTPLVCHLDVRIANFAPHLFLAFYHFHLANSCHYTYH